MNRRGFLGSLVGLAALPLALLKRRCQHEFSYQTGRCKKCGISAMEMWRKAAKNTPMRVRPPEEREFGFYTNYATLQQLEDTLS